MRGMRAVFSTQISAGRKSVTLRGMMIFANRDQLVICASPRAATTVRKSRRSGSTRSRQYPIVSGSKASKLDQATLTEAPSAEYTVTPQICPERKNPNREPATTAIPSATQKRTRSLHRIETQHNRVQQTAVSARKEMAQKYRRSTRLVIARKYSEERV